MSGTARDNGPTSSPDDADETDDAAVDQRSFSLYDNIRTPAEERTLLRLPSLTARAVGLVWRAGKRPFLVSAGLQLLSGVAMAAQLLVARHVLDAVITADRTGAGVGSVTPSLLALVGITTLLGFASAIQTELSALLTELVSREATGRILDVACAVDLEAYETPAFHDRLERARFNANTRPVMAVNGLLGVVSASIATTAIAAALLVLHPLLVPVALVALLPLWMAESRNSRAYYRFAVDLTPIDRERTYLANTLSAKDTAKEIRAFSIAGFLRSRFDDLYAHRIDLVRRLVRARLRRTLLGSLLGSVVAAATLLVLLELLLTGRMSLASTGAAVLGVVYLGQRLRALVSSAGTLYESALFIEDFYLFLDLTPAVESARATAMLPAAFERIVVDDLTFTYPGASSPALRNVSMEIGHGEVVALVGDNGSGKTTLAKILGLLYRPDAGHVRWDGVAADTCDAEAGRRSIAVIFQDFGRYWLSARNNIGIGDTERLDDIDDIVAAARSTQADEFLSPLPHGYETVLSRLFEGGRDLSVGQWQRIALARAFFRDAPLVIMDEPTAALDAGAEARLFESIREIALDRSVLLISHRFSSVRSADRIYVLHKGEVVETGTHEALMDHGGRYAAMFSLQASAYLAPERR
ncbi:MAG: ATP-binding cassette, subfamily bacterial [Acidimicrobiaceae bacterium]